MNTDFIIRPLYTALQIRACSRPHQPHRIKKLSSGLTPKESYNTNTK